MTGIGWRYDIPRFNGRAACAETDPEAFFPEVGGSARPAKSVCKGCEVRVECLAWALTHDEAGVWGGLSEFERRTAVRNRTRGDRPLSPIRHGTSGGYRMHHRRGERPCPECVKAEALKNSERRKESA